MPGDDHDEKLAEHIMRWLGLSATGVALLWVALTILGVLP